MKEYQSLKHTRRDCKCSIVFIPRRRRQKTWRTGTATRGDFLRINRPITPLYFND